MLAYAAHRRTIAQRRSAPHVMLVIAVAHIALIAAVMSAKMDLPQRIFEPPIFITPIEVPKPPPPDDPTAAPPTKIDRVPVIVPVPQPNPIPLQPVPEPSFINEPVIQPRVIPEPTPGISANAPVRVAARFVTPPSAVRPPYPPSKLDTEEEAALRLRLSIDERGRVIAVEPVGRADPAFLAAARRHLLAHWRYRPATEDGRAVASATLITLRFEIEN